MMDLIGNMPDLIIAQKVRAAYTKYTKLYNEHCSHDCHKNNCSREETKRIQNICWVLDDILEVFKK